MGTLDSHEKCETSGVSLELNPRHPTEQTNGWVRFFRVDFAAGGFCVGQFRYIVSHRIHVWHQIYLHLVDFYGKCR